MLKHTQSKQFIEEATTDCYDDGECRMGFCTKLEDNLPASFVATIVGEEVRVIGVELAYARILVFCVKNGKKYKVDILDIEVDKSV